MRIAIEDASARALGLLSATSNVGRELRDLCEDFCVFVRDLVTADLSDYYDLGIATYVCSTRR